MHQALPYGIGVSGHEPTDRDRLFIASYIKKVENYRATSGVDSVKYVRSLPDGGVVVIYSHFGILKAVVLKDKQEKQSLFDGLATDYIPMLFSGAFRKTDAIQPTEGVRVELTTECVRRVGQYDASTSTKKIQELHKFKADYSPYFQELKPEIADSFSPDVLLFSQYTHHRPTWYSGAMAEVVQISSGFGRQDTLKLPDAPIERDPMRVPEPYLSNIRSELKDVRLPGYTGQPDIDGFIQCSYKFHDTNLVAFDTGKNPWLLQISDNGVWAMPLPVIPATTTKAFAAYVRFVRDTELQKILDRFKGIPSGESFPKGADFHHWVRAGVIIKVCGTLDFYKKSGYSTAHGWTCNTDATEIANTCYDYKGNLCYGYTYTIHPKLGIAKNNGRLNALTISNLTADQMRRLSAYMSGLFDLMPANSAATNAIKYKLRGVHYTQLLARTTKKPDQSEVDYWLNYQAPSIADHSGNIIIENEGYLHDGNVLKVPEPVIKGLVSMDFSVKDLNDTERLGVSRLDTTVLVYFIGDNKKVVKNTKDTRAAVTYIEGNFEDSMIIGEWEQTEYITPMSIVGNYYTTDFDFRKTLSETMEYKKIVGKDIGYGQPNMYFNPFFMYGSLSRARYYSYETTTKKTRGNTFYVAALMPYYSRNSLLFATTEKYSYESESYSLYMKSAPDPNRYSVWTFHEALHWAPFDIFNPRYGTPYPVDGVPVYAERYHKADPGASPITTYADSGDWVGAMPADVTYMYGMTGTPPQFTDKSSNSEDKNPDPTYSLHCSIVDPPFLLSTEPHREDYYVLSPNTVTNHVVYEDSSKVVFGESKYASISYNLTSRKAFGYSKLADKKNATNFFGVINE